ncbi:MAG: TonB-dependent receptor [Sphingomonas sp.]|uniref:TonB-dependent receptor domain-containing protein n=1 Tax=Sphingomonas sp. TaxID=28214 RepID=UPI0035677907
MRIFRASCGHETGRRRAYARAVRRWRTLAAPLAIGVAVMALPPAAHARSAEMSFDLPAEDLAAALNRFARQASVQILFPYDAVKGRTSARLNGRMAPRRALERLLVDSGLAIAGFRDGRVTLRRAPEPRRPPRQPPHRVVRPPPAPAPPAAAGEEIVVTGRVGTSQREKTALSYAFSAISRDDLDREAPASTAELFRQVPGFWVESSGGEAGNNVRARGIPTDGFSAIAFAENGIPVQYDGGLGYLNTDQSYRLDQTVERVEVVRGGPASLFMPNAPGGVANVITRSGLTTRGGHVEAIWGDRGYRRLDGYYATHLGPDWGLLAGGFYHRDGGRRDPGFTADSGGQLRATLDYDDGAGNRASLDIRHLDDRVAFYLPVPLRLGAGGKVAGIPGFDPLTASLPGPETTRVAILTAGAPFDFDLREGTHVRLTAITARAHLALGNAFQLSSSLRWRTSATLRNALFPTGTPMPAADFLDTVRARTLAAFPGATTLRLRYAVDGAPLPGNANGNGLVLGANLLSVSVPLDEFLADNRVTRRFELGGSHDLAFGATFATYSYRFDRQMGTVLLDVRDQARLLDVVALDALGAPVGRYTDHGFQRYGSAYDSAALSVDAFALYAADEWQVTPALRLDYGMRWEGNWIHGDAAAKTIVDLGDPGTLADDAVLSPSGARLAVRQRYHGWNWSVGANYQLSPALGLFARYTATNRLPSASEFNGNPTRTDEAPVPIKLAELGIKHSGRPLAFYATGFYTHFQRLPFTDFRFDTILNDYVERTAIADTRTLGVELEATWRPAGRFELGLRATWQEPRYRNFAFAEIVDGAPVTHDYSGNQLIRVPRLALRATPAMTFFDGKLRTEFSIEHFARRYSDIANHQLLPAYTLLGFNAVAHPRPGLNLGLHIVNLANTFGLTEGNPRTGSFDTGSSSTYFLARPEFGRSVRLNVGLPF